MRSHSTPEGPLHFYAIFELHAWLQQIGGLTCPSIGSVRICEDWRFELQLRRRGCKVMRRHPHYVGTHTMILSAGLEGQEERP